MTSTRAYLGLILLVGAVRLVELEIARRHTAWAISRGGVESGRRHYPAMVALHVGLFAGCAAEVLLLHRPFLPALGWPMLGVLLAAHGLRWWCIATLGRQWTTRVIVVPGLPLVRTGPYRWLRHPNYLAVRLEGLALPLVHTAWITALAFTLLNSVLLGIRVRVEERALRLAG